MNIISSSLERQPIYARAFYEGAEAHREMHAGTWQWIKYYKDESGIAFFTSEVLTGHSAFIERALKLRWQMMLGALSCADSF